MACVVVLETGTVCQGLLLVGRFGHARHEAPIPGNCAEDRESNVNS